jgi:hypothetical protein
MDYVNERPVNDPVVAALTAAAARHWQSRGVKIPPGVLYKVADDLRDSDVDAYPAGRGADPKLYGVAKVVLDGQTTGIELRRSRSKRRPAKFRRQALERLGQTITHELGHVAGIREHTPGGVMAPMASRDDVPWEIKREAKRLVPRDKTSKGKNAKRVRKQIRPSGGVDW